MKFTEWDISTFITWEIRDGDTVPIYLLDFYNRIINVHASTIKIYIILLAKSATACRRASRIQMKKPC